MPASFDSIKQQVEELATKINAPQKLLPTYGQTLDGAHPHIEIDDNGNYHYVVVERGQELRRDIAKDMDDLLFMIFSSVTFSMASDFELHHRRTQEDSRRQLFSKQEELLGTLNPQWQQRQHEEHNHILERHPFTDK